MATEFIAEEGPLRGLVLTLDQGDEWIIGRDPDFCDLVVEDPKASRKHIVCRRISEGFEIENLSETNPILVNGQPISGPTLLKDRDKVKIGSNEFRFFVNRLQEDLEKILAAPSEEPPETYDTIYREEEIKTHEVHFDVSTRFLLKVITGPNTGGEFGLEFGRDYFIGTDNATCDIVFHDLSISRQHALLSVSPEGEITIEDRGSRNGVIVDRERIEGKVVLNPNSIATLGTTSFFIIDREAPRETIVAPHIEPERRLESAFEKEQREETPFLKETMPSFPEKTAELALKPPKSMAGLLLMIILIGAAALLGIGMISLFKEGHEIATQLPDYNHEIQNALGSYPDVRFTFNKNNGRLFLLGHVSTAIQKSELLYNLRGLNYITGIDDNVVIDEYIWQEMNITLAKNPDWRGISMHSPAPGKFVLSGYLKTTQEATSLSDYINLNFNYLDRLQNEVVVEEQLMKEVSAGLLQKGFNGVTPAISNGELTLTGYINSAQSAEFQSIVTGFSKIFGIRAVRNYVVSLSPEQAIVDLSDRYKVTGYSKYGAVNINVVIDGRILTRGDKLDGLTIMSIQPHTIFLEKDGLKYKIEYNK